ncbi:MAG: hypothetical protein ACRDM1_03985 [Gaiellaceae bacterium]
MRRMLQLALLWWLTLWAARELAGRLGSRAPARAKPSHDAPHPPGWMPGPLD